MSAREILQHLYSLDNSSPNFLRVLYGLIRHDEDEQYSSSLGGEELAQLVDFLDDALNTIPTSDDVFRQCLRKLRAICGYHTTLPTSHVIRGDLARTGESAIAFGGFADVWQGTHDGRRVCIKVFRVSLNDRESLTKSFFKEAIVWKRLKHPNVVPFLGVTNKPLQFVSEWMPNGTLTHYVRENPQADRIALLLDVAEGLNYLHTSYTVHGDLKGPNVLVDNNGHARLTDFGLASIVRGTNSVLASRPEGYTLRWTAPEILKGANTITREADVFSFGMVVVEVFTGSHPFSDLSSPSVMLRIMDGERPARPQGTQGLGLVDPIWDMTVNCWQQDPACRPTMAEVVGFLRECYTLCAAKQPLSALAPWQTTGGASDATAHAIISPAPTDGSPPLSSGTSQYSGQSYFQTHETPATAGSTFKALLPGVSLSSGSPSDTPLDEHHRASYSGDSNGNHLAPIVHSIRAATLGHGTPIQHARVLDQNIQPGNDQIPTQSDANGRRQPVRSATFDEPKTSPSIYNLIRTMSLPARKDPRPSPPVGPGFNGKKEKHKQKTGKGLWRGIAATIRFTVFAKRKSVEDHDGG